MKLHEKMFRDQCERFVGEGYTAGTSNDRTAFISRDASLTSLLSNDPINFSSQSPSNYVNVQSSKPDSRSPPSRPVPSRLVPSRPVS